MHEQPLQEELQMKPPKGKSLAVALLLLLHASVLPARVTKTR